MKSFWLILTVSVLSVLCDDKDGGKAPRIPLNDGNSIPAMGYGTFLGFNKDGQIIAKDHEVENSVTWALDAGYRLVDTASAYHNEDHVGKAVELSSVPREDIYVVTKLGMTEHRDVVGSLKNSLTRLNMSYVDLYLIHFPVAFKADFSGFDVIDYLDTWKSMEEAKRFGLTKSIGLSNFNISQIQRVLDNCEIKPAVLQVEVNLNLAQDKLIDYCKKEGIVVMAYSPFGSLFESSKTPPPPPRANHPTLVEIANKSQKTTPQIVIRYLLQRGVIPIPKSLKKERIEENIDIFDFELSPEDMETLSKFNTGYRKVFPSFWQDHPYYPFEKKDMVDPNPFKDKF